MCTNADHPASWTDLARRVRASPFTARSSTATAWFSRISWVESWWWNSRRASATRACARATFSRALSRLREPFTLWERARCAFSRRFSARRRKRGLSTFVPSEWTAKWPRPRSMPSSGVVSGITSDGPVSTTKEAKYRPALSLTTVTVDGVEGSVRDHFTLRSPIFGRRSFCPKVMDQWAFAVNRTACRVSLRDLYRGAPILGRLPLSPSKKFLYAVSRSRRDCWRTTADTSPSHARSGVCLASVINVFDRCPVFGNGMLHCGRSPEREARRCRPLAHTRTPSPALTADRHSGTGGSCTEAARRS